MKRWSLLGCVGLAAAVVAAGCAAPEPMAMEGTAEDEAAIRALATAYETAFNAGDAAGLAALVADEYETVTADGTHVMGPAGVEAYEGAAMQERMARAADMTLSIEPMFVNWIDAGHALMGGTWSTTGAPEGMPDSGSFLVVAAAAEDGSWEMLSGLPSQYVEPPAPPMEGDEEMDM